VDFFHALWKRDIPRFNAFYATKYNVISKINPTFFTPTDITIFKHSWNPTGVSH